MKTVVLLIRHGETDWNRDGRWQGQTDVPLSDAGLRQAHAVADRLAGWPITAVYSSDLQRAAATAEVVAGRHGLEPLLLSELREGSAGEFEGLRWLSLAERQPALMESIRQGSQAPPGGESALELANRAVPALERIVMAHQGETAAVVTHGGTLRALIGHLLGVPLDRRRTLGVGGNGGLTVVEFYDEWPSLRLLNDTCHLGGPWREPTRW
jgi:broad specificity phosphatase PhoE